MSDLEHIHVNNSTGVSLNDRFTVISESRRSRSESRNGRGDPGNMPARNMPQRNRPRNAPIRKRLPPNANHRLLQELARKNKQQTAIKLKRVCS